MSKGDILGHFHRVSILSAAWRPPALTTPLGPFGRLRTGSGDDVEETSSELGRDDHVEEEVGRRTNGVEEVGNPSEVIQLVGV